MNVYVSICINVEDDADAQDIAEKAVLAVSDKFQFNNVDLHEVEVC